MKKTEEITTLKKYVYPRLSRHELFGIRLGGAGMGNLLFIYSRAIVYGKKNGLEMIWPTWTSIHIGPYIRKEKDKRSYHNVFKPNIDDIRGVHKYLLLFFCCDQIEFFDYENSMTVSFQDIKENHELIKNTLVQRISNNNEASGMIVGESPCL